MSPSEAVEILQVNSLTPDESSDPRVLQGVVGSLHTRLKPPSEATCDEIMEALRVLGPALKEPLVDRAVVLSMHAILNYIVYAMGTLSHLRAWKHLTSDDLNFLRRWHLRLQLTYGSLLNPKEPLKEAFKYYRRAKKK